MEFIALVEENRQVRASILNHFHVGVDTWADFKFKEIAIRKI